MNSLSHVHSAEKMATARRMTTRKPAERTPQTSAAAGLPRRIGIRPASATTWKMSISTATVSAMKPKDTAVRPDIWSSLHSRKGTGCLRSSVAITDGSAAITGATPRFARISLSVEPAWTSVHVKPAWSWWRPTPYVGPRSSSRRWWRPCDFKAGLVTTFRWRASLSLITDVPSASTMPTKRAMTAATMTERTCMSLACVAMPEVATGTSPPAPSTLTSDIFVLDLPFSTFSGVASILR
mmetsp:Transcript_45513/g.119574  ORF Transcript_45513/g.119574 Transcript_45513/m.119574 type:complete len:239 (-) Transcript_45513:220-936(-)